MGVVGRSNTLLPLLAMAAGLALVACARPGARPIAYGRESCANCLMTVTDDRFGAELVTRRGKVYVFDSPECLAEYVRAHPRESAGSLWVTAFDQPGTLVPAESAEYVRVTAVSSPMGLGVAAFTPGGPRRAVVAGPPLTWAQVVALAATPDGATHASPE